MRSAQVLAVRAALLGLVLAGTGCFRPKILPGGFACGDAGAGVNGICPDGLLCDPRSGTCVSSIGGAGGGGTGGAAGKGGQGGQGGGKAGMDGGVRDMAPDVPVTCLPSVATTTCPASDAGTGMCDPVCNTGCGQCNEKCSVNTSGNLTCNIPTGGGTVGLSQPCSPSKSGAAQTDNCAPGLVCLNVSVCQYRCYQFCRTSADCSNGAGCSRDAGGGYSFCDVPQTTCDPILGAQKIGCPGPPLFTCYLSSTTDQTVCDCQTGMTSGAVGASCTRSRDCFAGLICIDFQGNGSKFCKKVCRLPGDGGVNLTNADAGEEGCVDYRNCLPIVLPSGTNDPTYGYCNE